DVLEAHRQWQQLPDFSAQLDRDTADAMLAEAARITEERIAPLNRSGDEEGARWDSGVVTTPAGFVDAYRVWRDGGFTALTGNPDFGGLGMPKALSVLVEEMLYAANSSFALYPALSIGACMSIDAHATNELKQRFLPKLYAGEWTGSMCLTESHSGSDLGLIRTKAVPNGDGTYAISGTKIFITGGEHDLSDNIVHLVLAKLPDAPAGSRGISLFLVPKIWVNEDGSLGHHNGVSCGSIEHKMGIKASATCVLNFDGARGYLVGEANKGLACMFTMMNCERLSIGIQGTGCAEMSYQNAVAYARERLQGRDVNGGDKSRAADPIIVHPDVRRMLLNIRSTTEGGRALAVYLGMQLDLANHADSAEQRARADALVALLTPVAKAFFTDLGLDGTVLGQQVFGGHGYIREWGQEQLVRDARIAQIYEGTNGIQALDLIQRKVFANRGSSIDLFLAEVNDCAKQIGSATLKPFAADVLQRSAQLQDLTHTLLDRGAAAPAELGAAACDYLHVVGYVTYAYLWLRMMAVAEQQKGNPFALTKLKTGTYYFHRILPRVDSLIAAIRAGASDIMAFSAGEF
ncbi:MAG TPA: acyl-CoA dehydrogenase C-terminal domain-containing protein, partial [Candidatus Kapabacteria bacterium]|nr:acyl-CoA dehydrogenase C-terminal domain-containing protein [Candidatus Kapabacteria bacterium]